MKQARGTTNHRTVWQGLGLAWAMVVFCTCCPGADRQPVEPACSLFEVTAIRFSRTCHTRTLRGYFATDGRTRHRIAFYGLHPALISDVGDHLAYCDIIFRDGDVSGWVSEPFKDVVRLRFKLPPATESFHLPADNQLASLLQSAFLAVSHSRSGPAPAAESWAMAQFFAGCRDVNAYEHTMEPPVYSRPFDRAPQPRMGDAQIFNELPFGRTYRKKVQTDGTCAWQMSRASVAKDAVRLVLQACAPPEPSHAAETFDPNTLGRWSVVPDAYRTYWQRWRQYVDLRRSKEKKQDMARELFAQVEGCLKSSLPDDLALALNKLRFDVSLETGEEDTISRAARQYFAAYMHIAAKPVDQIIVELGRIAKEVRARWTEEKVRLLICPLLQTLTEPEVFSHKGFLDDIFTDIRMQGWFWYGQLVIDVIREKGCADPNFLTAAATDFQTRHLALAVSDPDPNDFTPSARDLLRDLGAPAPRGALDANELRILLEQALSDRWADATSDTRASLVGRVLRSVRNMAGDGPYAGDREKLKESLAAAVGQYVGSQLAPEQIHSTLATFLLLSFYDTSTSHDHTVLRSQLQEVSARLEGEVRTILAREGGAVLVEPETIARAFEAANESIGRYVNDPLCPMFKFPLSENEKTRLIHTTRLSLRKLQDDASRLGPNAREGADTRILAKTIEADLNVLAGEIAASLVRFRLPRGLAELRGRSRDRPSVIVRADLYERTDEGKAELLRKMMYFYLGHRMGAMPSQERRGPGPEERK